VLEAAAEAPLPTFVIAGAMRSGTTSLNRWLRGHPDVWMSPNKELHYFDTRWERGVTVDEYRQSFAGWSDQHAVGEATPNYVYHRDAMERLASVVPDVRVVLSLRHPVDRAHSHYWARRSRGIDTRGFAEVIATEPDVPLTDDGGLMARGRYLEQIQRTLRYVDRDQLLVVLFDDLEREPTETFAEVCAFIGVDTTTVPAEVGEAANRHRHFRSERVRRLSLRLPKSLGNAVGHLNSRAEAYPTMDAPLRSVLCEQFRPHNDALGEWLGRDLSMWDT
jgi:hypothetical protein